MQFKMAIQTLQKKVIRRGIQYNLDTVRSALSECEHPENLTAKVIHLAGTNGKGSTLSFLKSGFLGAKKTVGSFTSPHIKTYRERIQYQGEWISEEDFSRLFEKVSKIPSYDEISEFECLTLMFFLYMSEKQPEVVLLETGVGGRLDSTNVTRKDAAVITSIGIDHESILGDTIEKIASEKAGIIQEEKPVFSIRQSEAVEGVLKGEAEKKKASYYRVEPLEKLPEESQLRGGAQLKNRALAKAVLKFFLPERGDLLIESDLNKASHWGRLTKTTFSGCPILVDGAHNSQAMEQLARTLKEDYSNQKWTVLIQVLKTRDLAVLIDALKPIAKNIVYIISRDLQFFDPRDQKDSNSIAYFLEEELESKLKEVDGPILVTGSLYFIAKFKD